MYIYLFPDSKASISSGVASSIILNESFLKSCAYNSSCCPMRLKKKYKVKFLFVVTDYTPTRNFYLFKGCTATNFK